MLLSLVEGPMALCGEGMGNKWEAHGGREAEGRGHGDITWHGKALCSLGSIKSVFFPKCKLQSPRVVHGMLWSLPASPVTMVSCRLHHSPEHKENRLAPIFL